MFLPVAIDTRLKKFEFLWSILNIIISELPIVDKSLTIMVNRWKWDVSYPYATPMQKYDQTGYYPVPTAWCLVSGDQWSIVRTAPYRALFPRVFEKILVSSCTIPNEPSSPNKSDWKYWHLLSKYLRKRAPAFSRQSVFCCNPSYLAEQSLYMHTIPKGWRDKTFLVPYLFHISFGRVALVWRSGFVSLLLKKPPIIEGRRLNWSDLPYLQGFRNNHKDAVMDHFTRNSLLNPVQFGITPGRTTTMQLFHAEGSGYAHWIRKFGGVCMLIQYESSDRNYLHLSWSTNQHWKLLEVIAGLEMLRTKMLQSKLMVSSFEVSSLPFPTHTQCNI